VKTPLRNDSLNIGINKRQENLSRARRVERSECLNKGVLALLERVRVGCKFAQELACCVTPTLAERVDQSVQLVNAQSPRGNNIVNLCDSFGRLVHEWAQGQETIQEVSVRVLKPLLGPFDYRVNKTEDHTRGQDDARNQQSHRRIQAGVLLPSLWYRKCIDNYLRRSEAVNSR